MPLYLLRCYVAMMPRLRAKESLLRIRDSQAADPWIDGDHRQSLMRRIRKQVGIEEAERPRASRAEVAAAFRALGPGEVDL